MVGEPGREHSKETDLVGILIPDFQPPKQLVFLGVLPIYTTAMNIQEYHLHSDEIRYSRIF